MPDEKVRVPREAYARLLDKFNKLDINKKKNPGLSKMMDLMTDPEACIYNKSQISMLAFSYLNSNVSDLFWSSSREKYELVFCLLALNDGDFARSFAKKLNKDEYANLNIEMDKMMGPFSENNRKRPLETTKIFKRWGLGYSKRDEKPVSELTKNEKISIENLKTIYKVMTEKADSIFYHNTVEYKAMVSSIKNAIDYVENKAISVDGKKSSAVDKEVMQALFNNVADKTAAYIDAKGIAPKTKHGETRLNAAFAALYSVNRRKADDLLEENTAARQEKWKKITDKDLLSVKSVLEKTGTEKFDLFDEKRSNLVDSIDSLQWQINHSIGEDGFNRIDAMAEYLVKTEMLKTMDATQKGVDMSKDTLNKNIFALKLNPTFLLEAISKVSQAEINMTEFTTNLENKYAENKTSIKETIKVNNIDYITEQAIKEGDEAAQARRPKPAREFIDDINAKYKANEIKDQKVNQNTNIDPNVVKKINDIGPMGLN